MYFLTRPYLWLFFVVTGITAQNETNPTKFSKAKYQDTISESDLKENLLDFWIGEWEVHWKEKDGTIGKGTNMIKYILNGAAIQEDFIVNKGMLKGFRGKSLSIFRKDRKQWKQVWIDNDGGYFEFTGDIENDFPVFKTDLVQRNGREYKFRMVFREIKSSSFLWDWEMSTDQGKTWKLKWQISYLRK